MDGMVELFYLLQPVTVGPEAKRIPPGWIDESLADQIKLLWPTTWGELLKTRSEAVALMQNWCVHVSANGQAFEGIWVRAPNAACAEARARLAKGGLIAAVRVEPWAGPWPPTATAVTYA